MIKEPFQYLKNFDLAEIKALLVEIPSVRDFILQKQLSDIIRGVLVRIPQELLHEYHSTLSRDSEKRLRGWLSENCNGAELNYMYSHFNLSFMGAISI